MSHSLRPYSTEDLTKWVEKLKSLGDNISIGSAQRIGMLMEREKDLLDQLHRKGRYAP